MSGPARTKTEPPAEVQACEMRGSVVPPCLEPAWRLHRLPATSQLAGTLVIKHLFQGQAEHLEEKRPRTTQAVLGAMHLWGR